MRPATLGCGGPRLLAWALSISPPGAQSARHTEQLRVWQGPRSFREPARGAGTLGEGGQVAPSAGIHAAASGAVWRGSAVRRGGGGLTRPAPTLQPRSPPPLPGPAPASCPGLRRNQICPFPLPGRLLPAPQPGVQASALPSASPDFRTCPSALAAKFLPPSLCPAPRGQLCAGLPPPPHSS